jgi:hypothetical protein
MLAEVARQPVDLLVQPDESSGARMPMRQAGLFHLRRNQACAEIIRK